MGNFQSWQICQYFSLTRFAFFANFCQAVRPIRNGRSESRRLPGQRLSANYLYSILSTFLVLHFNLSFTKSLALFYQLSSFLFIS